MKRCLQLLRFILRVGMPHKNSSIYKHQFNSYEYVRSRFIFASSIWNPYQSVHKNKLEISVNSLSSLDYKTYHNHINYKLSLKTYDIIYLQHRRSVIDLTYFYKVTHIFVDASFCRKTYFFECHGLMRERIVKKSFLPSSWVGPVTVATVS